MHVIGYKTYYLPFFVALGPRTDAQWTGEAAMVVGEEDQRCRAIVDERVSLCGSGGPAIPTCPDIVSIVFEASKRLFYSK